MTYESDVLVSLGPTGDGSAYGEARSIMAMPADGAAPVSRDASESRTASEGRPKPVFPRRTQAKQLTRIKLLDAARRLFIEHGYEATTLRDVAAAAGCSTGAVFASFADKADLFAAVVAAARDVLVRRLAESQTDVGSIDNVLATVSKVVHDVLIEEPGLLQATLNAPWRMEFNAARPDLDCKQPVIATLSKVLRRGAQTGVLRAPVDVDLAAEMLCDSFLSNCRRVLLESWSRDAACAYGKAQVQMLLTGLRNAAA